MFARKIGDHPYFTRFIDIAMEKSPKWKINDYRFFFTYFRARIAFCDIVTKNDQKNNPRAR